MENVGSYFKALREAKGMTLREVEKLVDVSNAYLSQLEQGKVKQPSPLTLHKLAEVYGVSYEHLMEKVGYPVPQAADLKKLSATNKSMAAKVGNLTSDEEIELLNYLKFIRTRKK
jgi:transcriptional regulator with XRE-family HTH domain